MISTTAGARTLSGNSWNGTGGHLPGTAATVWQPLGACGRPVSGTQTWEGLFAIDVRLSGPGAAKIIFAGAPGGLAVQSALCTATRDNSGAPQIVCTAAGPLS